MANIKIKVYSTPSCPYCVTLKEFLRDNNFEFEDLDVSINQGALKEMVDNSKQMGVPVIDINGEIVVGFDRARINELLKIKN